MEEQRVTSYLLLVKTRRTFGDFVDLRLVFLYNLRVDVEVLIVCRGLSLGFKTVCCWGALSEITVERGSRWNKKVNLLLVCFAGYECFLPPLFIAHSLWLLKEEKSSRATQTPLYYSGLCKHILFRELTLCFGLWKLFSHGFNWWRVCLIIVHVCCSKKAIIYRSINLIYVKNVSLSCLFALLYVTNGFCDSRTLHRNEAVVWSARVRLLWFFVT